MCRSQLRAVVGRVLDSSHLAECVAERSSEVGTQASRNIETQQQQLEQLAVAMQEVSATVTDMARNSCMTADATQRALQISTEGQQVVANSVTASQNLAVRLEQVTQQIHQLSAQSSRIDEVIHVIDGIAGQTNLLALNAAIEAARAGDQGRGFAVVADEVRALAQRTQQSTAEIQQMIERLQSNSGNAVRVIAESSEATRLTVEQAGQARESLGQIGGALRNLAVVNASEEHTSEL